MRELKLTQIWIYPIKSLAGIPLSHSRVMGKGLELDRRWMLVDQDGVFITQRVHSILALFRQSLTPEELVVEFKGDSIAIPLNEASPADTIIVQIWDDTVTAYEVSQTHSAWFSERLGIPCRLVRFPEGNPRAVDVDWSQKGDNVSLADAYPLLVIGEASLDDLNSRLPVPVTMKRFRPNLVFSGGTPFQEDSWKEFNIGHGRFEGVKQCARCVLTTVDPETSLKGPEPLKTLAQFRKWNNKIYFGQNTIARNESTIHVGDTINVIRVSEPDGKLIALSQHLNRT